MKGAKIRKPVKGGTKTKGVKGMISKSSPSVYERITKKKNPKFADKMYN